MKWRIKFAFWLALLFVALTAVVVAFVLVILAGAPQADRERLLALLGEQAAMLVYVGLMLLVAYGGALKWLFENYVRAPGRLAEQTGVILAAQSGFQVGIDAAPEFRDLERAINRLAERYHGLEQDLEARAAESGARREEERNRLAALMSQLVEGVLVCTSEGRILLYNERARALFDAGGIGVTNTEPRALVGLGRSVFALLDRDQVTHALEKVQAGLDKGVQNPAARFIAAVKGDALIKVNLAPVLSAERGIAGVVLTLEDVTRLASRENQRSALLQAMAGDVRGPIANVRAAAENLAQFGDMEPARRDEFIGIVVSEARNASEVVDRALNAHADALKAGLALEDMTGADLLRAAARRIATRLGLSTSVEKVDETVWLRVESYSFVQAMTYVAARLKDEYGVRELRLRLAASARFAEIDLVWHGALLSHETLPYWEEELMQVGGESSTLRLKDVLQRHGGEAWYAADRPNQTGWVRFLLPLSEAGSVVVRREPVAGSRPEFYDFDLFNRPVAGEQLSAERLADLNYTVFDTETTGLAPLAGDEIISIGAVRIVNGRLLKHESFEQLIDPGRPMARKSVRVHGIEPGTLVGQPRIDAVLPAFLGFCEETVLVAHNAAFDLRFLQIKEASSGVRFEQPVLDTLLLSAVVHPNLEDHRLESIAARFGVSVIGRHTALGDAIVTGEIFLRMLPMLAEIGIVTLGDALAASQRTYYARLQY